MKRKDFVKILGTAAVLPSVSFGSTFITDLPKIKPRRIKPGDKIGITAPGGFITKKELQESVENIKALGFEPVYSSKILNRYGYLAGSDKERADDLNEMFSRKDVAGIICARGGYGCARLLHLLDYGTISKNPKVLVGYSDITALLYAIYAKTGLVCFHGPVGISTFNDFSVQYFRDVLLNPQQNLQMTGPVNDPAAVPLHTIKSGSATGELVGGNLSIVVSLIGTPYDINSDGKIIFLEEINEEPYRIDRMLTQMIQAGKFTNARGIALGVFRKCEPKDVDPAFPKSLSLFEVLEDRLLDLGIPVLYGLSFGHITDKFTLPFGIRAGLDSFNKTLTLLEPAVL
jgi:muramoyltetrapeptide carboxypeptidase